MKILNVGLSLALTCTLISCGGQPAQEQATFVDAPQAQSSQVGKIGTLAVAVKPTPIDVSLAMTGAPKTVNKIGSQSVAPMTQASINAVTAQKISTDPYVTLKFANGSTFTYANSGGIALTSDDSGYAMSSEMSDLAASYNGYVQKKLSTITTQSNIGLSICNFFDLGCWFGDKKSSAWPNGKIYYRISSDFNSSEVALIRSAVEKWNISTSNNPQYVENLSLVGPPLTTVFRRKITSFGCGIAFVGYALQWWHPDIYVGEGCLTVGKITHEMGHAAGLNHEHQRCDRDQYLSGDFSGDWFNYNTLCTFGRDVGKFNYDSVMLYRLARFAPKFSIMGDSTTSYRGNPQLYGTEPGDLDVGDIEDGLRALYPQDLKSQKDLFMVKKSGTGTGKSEVHVLTASSKFQAFSTQTGSVFGISGAETDFKLADWDGDGIPDLFGIARNNTGTGKTEVHISSGASNYQKFVFQSGTALGLYPSGDEFELGDFDRDGRPDLFFIKKKNTGKSRTEIHVLTGLSNYSKFYIQTPTVFGEYGDELTFKLADWDGDGLPDLFGIKKNNTGTGKTEVHIASGASNYQNIIFQSGTALGITNSEWEFELGNKYGNGRPDLYAIRKSGSGTGRTEVRILSGANNYQTFVYENITPLGFTGLDFDYMLSN
jgi:Astacin (Peptidase family M12A)/FG-GAP-like repeat